MAQVAERLVGRADEIGSMEAALTALERGRPATLELAGEPGIGKTRLLAELSARADARGFLVLSGCAAELERDLPFWVFVDALDEYVQALGPHRLDGLDQVVRRELATVLPSLATLAEGPLVALSHERYRSHRAVRELLELLASTQPLVLVLDDLHWADPASVELLGALLRRPPSGAVLMALAVRPRQMLDRLSTALERGHRAGTLDLLELGALSRSEADDFLGETIDESDAADLYEESGGNPFYLEQLARGRGHAARAMPAAPDVSLGGIEVPATVAAALAEELALLSEGARRVLEGAAVAGDPFEPELAAAAAGAPEAAALDALDELLVLDLVRRTDVPRRFRFRHPLVRRAVYESTPGGWLLGAHERSADALAARGASASARAHHVERSARHGDLEAVAVLRSAGEEVRLQAPASSARWLAGALRLLPEAAPAEDRVALLMSQAGALAATGQFEDGRSALVESIDLVPPESFTLKVRLTAECAGLEHLLGRHDEAHARLTSALRGLPESASPEAVALMLGLAVDGFYRMELEVMRRSAARALAAALPLGDRPLTAAATATLAAAGALGGRVEEAETHCSEAAVLVAALADDELAPRLDAAVNLACAELYLDRYEEAGAHAERAIAIRRGAGQGDIFPILGAARWVRGQLAEAGELLDGAAEMARVSGNAVWLSWNLLNRSLVALAAGDIEMALATGEESRDLTRAGPHPSIVSIWADFALAGALLESGAPARAVDVLLGAAGGDELPLVPGAWRAACLELLSRGWLALGRRPEAARAAACAETCAAASSLRLPAAMAHRAAAAVALDSDEPTGAAERALDSADAADEAGAPIEAALSRTLAGRALGRAGQPDAAAAQLERAAAALDACGALRYRDDAERELRKLGRRIQRRTRSGIAGGIGVGSFTERELLVARLVVDRKTNSEIAAALYLSRKTVEGHIRNMFQKLGVSSRADIARAVERADRNSPRTESPLNAAD